MVTKQTSDFLKLDFKTGEVLLIDKPHSWTSFKVVNRIRRATNARRVGHAGTLDPLATGLLILCSPMALARSCPFPPPCSRL